MRKQQFKDVTDWQKKTFVNANSLSKIHHLIEEVNELRDIIETHPGNTDEVCMEFADCFLLLFGSAAAYGLSYDDICESIDTKLEINKNRTWGKPDVNGVVNHVN